MIADSLPVVVGVVAAPGVAAELGAGLETDEAVREAAYTYRAGGTDPGPVDAQAAG